MLIGNSKKRFARVVRSYLTADSHLQAVRNFVQLCLEGYYDNTPFFRIDKDFMAQAGDPTGTGLGGESVYDHPFSDEFHTRLKFNHRCAYHPRMPLTLMVQLPSFRQRAMQAEASRLTQK